MNNQEANEKPKKPKLTQEQADAFLAELTALTLKHGILIDGWEDPGLFPFFEPDCFWFSGLSWDKEEQKYTAEFCRDQFVGYEEDEEPNQREGGESDE